MNAPLATEPELETEFEARLVKRRRERLSRLSPEALAWLALPPAWTESLAQACGFPARPLAGFLDATLSLGLCAEAPTENLRANDREFWMPETARGDVLAHLQQTSGARFLHQQAVRIAEAVNGSEELRRRAEARALDRDDSAIAEVDVAPPASPVLVQWTTLAGKTAQDLGAGAAWFSQEIDRLLAPERNDTGKALALARTGELLAAALGGQLRAAVLRANHRIELAYRRAQDERHLASFLPRQEQIDAFNEIMNPDAPDATWALHYLGMGGVGKTMLIRHITAASGLAADCKRLATRVDFDHLSPNYPVRRPELLLVALADELRIHSEPSLFDCFQKYVDEMYEAFSEAPTNSNPLASLDSPAFHRVFRAFVDLLRHLSLPPLLILDTCEELAKFQPATGMPPSIAATFEIIERLHAQLPSLRVVFAGRRPLALAGAGWKIDTANLPEGKRHLPKEKSYLRLHEIRGFTDAEADRFFQRKLEGARAAKKEVPPLGTEMRSAILKRSRETGTAAAFSQYPGASRDEERFNPFDLALYASWFIDDRTLTAEMISSGQTDPYVQRRIVERLQPGVKDLLPAAVLLRRFEKAMLRPVFTGGNAAFDDACRALGEQEWIDYQPNETLKATFLEIDKKLFPRLRAYYADPDPLRAGSIEDAKSLLGSALTKLVEERPLAELGVEHVRAALRVLPVEEAARLWHGLDARITAEAQWSWAAGIMSRLLPREEDSDALDERLRPALLATYAAAQIHQQPDASLAQAWTDVAASAAGHPIREIAVWLEFRARAGAIAARRFVTPPAIAAGLQTVLASVDDRSPGNVPVAKAQALVDNIAARERAASTTAMADIEELLAVASKAPTAFEAQQAAGSLCAAAEALVDNAASPGEEEAVLALAEKATALGGVELKAFASVIRARAFLRAGRAGKTVKEFHHAITLVATVPGETCPQWADWQAPRSIRDRVRLEALCHLPRDAFPTDEVLDSWQNEAAAQLAIIDSERLVSRILALRLERGLVHVETLEALARSETYDVTRVPLCESHQATRPLFATIALARLALGHADAALAMVNARTGEAIRAGADAATVRAARMVKLQIIRRMRLAKADRALLASFETSTDQDDMVLGWPTLALNGITLPDLPNTPLDEAAAPVVRLRTIHAWWRSQTALTAAGALRLLETMQRLKWVLSDDGPVIAERFTTELDWQEMSALCDLWSSHETHLVASAWQRGQLLARSGPQRRRDFPSLADVPPHALALADLLRHSFLRGSSEAGPSVPAHFGSRAAAEIALEEGELLALRLPALAERFLETAQRLFDKAHDPAGVLICAITRVNAAIHAGHRELALKLISDTVQPAYESLVFSDSAAHLPTWPQLVAGVGSGDSAVLDALDHPSWSGWLYRLFRCLLWAAPLADKKKQAAQLRAFFERLPRPVSPEVIFTREDAELAAAQMRRVRPEKADLVIRLVATAAGVVAFATAALFVLKFLELEPLKDWLKENGETMQAFGMGTSSILWGLYIFVGIFYWICSRLAARRVIDLSILPTTAGVTNYDPAAAPSVIIGLLKRKRARRRSASETPRPALESVERRAQAPGLRPYAEAKDEMPPEILDVLTRLQARLTGRSWRHRLALAMNVHPGLNAYPWEAMLALSLKMPKRGTRLRRIMIVAALIFFGTQTLVAMAIPLVIAVLAAFFAPFYLIAAVPLMLGAWFVLPILFLAPWRKAGLELHFFRRSAPLPDEASRERAWQTGSVLVVCSSTWNLLVENGWRRLSEIVRATDTLPEPTAAHAPMRLLSLLGTAVRTTAGLHLQIASRATGSGSFALNSAGPARRGDHLLIAPNKLPLAQTRLVVLQGEPDESLSAKHAATDVRTPRSESSREQAALLRAFGADIFAAGAETVIVIPPLPPQLAQRVLETLGRKLAGRRFWPRRPLDLRRALDAVSAARRVILKAPLHSNDDATFQELAFDLCLFARSPELEHNPTPQPPVATPLAAMS